MKNLLLVVALGVWMNSNAQIITIDKYAQTVPKGKKWVIPLDEKILVNFDVGSLQRGTYCNELLNSNEPYLMSVLETYSGYGVQTKNSYNIEIGSIKKSIGQATIYNIIPSGYSQTIMDGRSSLNEEVKKESLIFYEGQIVRLSTCIVELQAFESPFTSKDREMLLKRKREEGLIAQKEQEEYELKKAKEDRRKFSECEQEKENYEWWVKGKGLIFKADDITFLPKQLTGQDSFSNVLKNRILNTLRPVGKNLDEFVIYVMSDSSIVVPDNCLGCDSTLIPIFSFQPGIRKNNACNMRVAMNVSVTLILKYYEGAFKYSKPFTIDYKIKNGEIKRYSVSSSLSQTKCTEEELNEIISSKEIKKLENGKYRFKYSKKTISYELRMNVKGDRYNTLISEGSFNLIQKL